MTTAFPVLPHDAPATLSTLPLSWTGLRDDGVGFRHLVAVLAERTLAVVPGVVLRWSDWLKVLWTNTRLVAAEVIEVHPFRDRSNPHDVGVSVGKHGLGLTLVAVGEVPVAVVSGLPLPSPAISAHCDFLNEPIFPGSVLHTKHITTDLGGS